MTAGIATSVRTAAKSLPQGAMKDYLTAVYRGLFIVAEIRSDVLHARPATHPDGQRLNRAEVVQRAITGNRFWIDDRWLDAKIARMNEVIADINAVRPPLR
ncbi:hypothetical protein [Catellatospora vulcania]|uniref:hypothetical protein n=1 Tax=Catellatospora vulcania TaxID=1460450 RepID=UPI0012D3779D|nr:hypothetical protein [Catellatospora vulcania]